MDPSLYAQQSRLGPLFQPGDPAHKEAVLIQGTRDSDDPQSPGNLRITEASLSGLLVASRPGCPQRILIARATGST